MSLRKRLLLFLLVLLALGVLDAALAPFVVARGVRFWVSWAAHRQGLAAEIEQVEAPFLRAVTLRNFSLRSANPGGHEISMRADSVIVDLNLHALIFRRPHRFLRSLRVHQVSGHIRVPVVSSTTAAPDWSSWAKSLPDDFQIDDLDFDVATATTSVSFRGVQLTASTIESGKFLARQISMMSPLLRQTFTNLRGATSWENARLTIAGIPLARGLDLEALTFDLARLARRRLGIDLHLDTYGGTLRASFQGRAGKKFAIDLAGSAANVSLAQISNAFGFLEPVTGSVRAAKFTFRGNPGQFLDATASIWMEATDFAWRARRADNVMLGATYYNRRLEVDQLYVRQSENALTVNGELLWPKKLESWTQLPFRGQISATIPDLNAFAQFFGAKTGDFSGALTAEGEVDLVDPAAAGRLSWQGQGVKFRGVGLDSLGGALRLQGREVVLEKLEARHGEDFLRAQGTVELGAARRFSGRLTGAIGDLGVYAPLLPAAWRAGKIGGGATFDWRGDGTPEAHSGTVQLFAHGLQLPVAPLRLPLDVTLEGSYSPQDVFFRTFKLAGDRFSLGGFLTLGNNFVDLQHFELTLEGAPRASGTLFLPLGFVRWRATHSLLAALDEAQKFDVDLVIDHLDLAALGEAVGEKSFGQGILEGKLAAYGALRTLQVTTEGRLEKIRPGLEPSRLNFSARLDDGRLEAEMTARFGVSAPVTGQASLPLQMEKSRWARQGMLDPRKPFSVTVDCPALFLESLPDQWRPGVAAGLLTGNITWSGKAAAPAIQGKADVLELRLQPPPPWPQVDGLRGHIQFFDTVAVIDPLRAEIDLTPIELRGRLTASLTEFGLTLALAETRAEVVSAPQAWSSLSGMRLLGEGRSEGLPRLQNIFVNGTLWPIAASLTITTSLSSEESGLAAQTTYLFQSGAAESKLLLLRIIPSDSAGLDLNSSLPR
ncbi:hypothetical protein BH20VER3_BH20VER3_23050 [soil metagenome]